MVGHEPWGKLDPRTMTLGQLMGQVCRLSGDRMRVVMERIGLHRGQGLVLLHLWHRDGMAQQEIARAKHVSPASVTNMLKRMERDGWIERRRDPQDERVMRVYLTEKAQAVREEAHASFHQIDDEIAGALTEDERTEFRRLLLKVFGQLAPASGRGFRMHDPSGCGEGGDRP